MRQALYSLFMLLMLASCKDVTNGDKKEEEKLDARAIIQQAIATHGGHTFEKAIIDFDFRGRHYRAQGIGGNFTYERSFTDTSGLAFRDVLTNTTFYREENGIRQTLASKDSAAYANSVNSVIYFALLPYFLQDPAAHASTLGEVTIKGEAYHKIKVTFGEEGGGKDFDDEYVYWIHRDNHTMDYLAYNYQVDGGGARFREAYNVRTIDGMRFADYINYKPTTKTLEVTTFDDLFAKGQLEELSKIETENIQVELAGMGKGTTE